MVEPGTGAQWEANAPAWIAMSRAGADRYRDLVNTPAFFDALPDTTGLRCLDVGCGEGHNTRLLVERGARITALDISQTFLCEARDADSTGRYVRGDAASLPFAPAAFDAVCAFMSIMDVADPAAAIGEIARVLRPGGWFQFSITHPVNTTPSRAWVDDEHGVRTSLAIADYFTEGPVTSSWTFKVAGELQERFDPFTITASRRTVSSWINMVVDAGFTIERVVEPVATEEVAVLHPEVADTRIVPFFLIVRAHL